MASNEELRAKFAELQEELNKSIEENIPRFSRPQIQRVPKFMDERVEFGSFYLPKLISIGPIHCMEYYKKPGTDCKFMWLAMYLMENHETPFNLFGKIFEHYGELSAYFSEDLCVELYRDPYWNAWMLAVDGCSVLQLLDKSDHSVNPEQELGVNFNKLVQAHQDLLLLENQIPFQVLKLLCNDESKLRKCLRNFLQVHGIYETSSMTAKEPEEHKVIVETLDQYDDDPVHLLDYLRRALLVRDQRQIDRVIKINRKSLRLRKYKIGTIMELKAAGIRVRKYPNNNSFYPSFSDGQLQLPELTVDGSTAVIFLNLIAYERCPDFCNDLEISSYVVFLSSLIDQPEDVKELRYGSILINELGSDKEAADLFNKMDSVLVPETARFAHIRDQIHLHLESKRCKTKMLGFCEGESSRIRTKENSKE